MNELTFPARCKGCVFAEYDGLCQVGCNLGRIDKFRERGADVKVELTDTDAPDGGVSTYVIKDRVCLARRTEDSDVIRTNRPNEWAKAVRKEIELRLEAVIVLNGGSSLEDLKMTVTSLEKQSLRPISTVIVINQDDVPALTVIWAMRGSTLPEWRVRHIREREENGERVSLERALDLSVDTEKRCLYYSVFHAGFEVPENFVSDIDRRLNDELEQFTMLMPIDEDDERNNGLTIQTYAHVKFGGNQPVHVLDEKTEEPIAYLPSIQGKIQYQAHQEAPA